MKKSKWRRVYSIVFRDGRWLPATGGSNTGKMTIHEARSEAKRRNREQGRK